ncbi:hypothetical protein [Coleofasciculus sp. G2-EDA-02]|uniref:hypothetical protein n=1 Tax=Coleofasciculus sp. G2-EDA-02 TaxID=3069529 RepID=UPI0032F6B563
MTKDKGQRTKDEAPLNLSKNGRMIIKMPPSVVVYHGLAVSHWDSCKIACEPFPPLFMPLVLSV